MRAIPAKRIKAGDLVVCHFSNSRLVAKVERVEWPHFHVAAQLSTGRIQREKRRYQSCEPVTDEPIPHWLAKPV